MKNIKHRRGSVKLELKERELEKMAVEKRYARLTDQTFSVSIIFLVPELQMGGKR